MWPYDPKAKLQDLGQRVQPLWHGAAVKDRVQDTLGQLAAIRRRPLDISPHEIVGLLFAAETHDLGENTHPDFVERYGEVIGDLPRGRKTQRHREIERQILTEILQTEFNYMSDSLLELAFGLSMHDPAVSDSLAGRIFEVSHEREEGAASLVAGDLGLTALRANEYATPRTEALIGIGKCITVPRISLEASIPEFPFLERILEDTQPLAAQITAANL